MIKSKLKARFPLYAFAILCLTCSCSKEYNCKSFDESHPFAKISIDAYAKEEILFVNSKKEELKLIKQEHSVSESYTQKCGIPSFAPCLCTSSLYSTYLDENNGNVFQVIINDVWDPAGYESQQTFEFQALDYFTLIYSPSRDSINLVLDSLTSDSIEYQGHFYTDILEPELYWNSNPSIVTRVWIKPGVGLFKFWMDGECWSLKEW